MKQKSIKRNIVFNVILTTSGFIFPLITYPYIMRVLLPAGTGKVAFVNSILSYFSHIAMLGIPSYGLREVAKCKDNKDELSKLVQELLIINICSVTITYIFLFSSVALVPKLNEQKTLFIIMSSSILLTSLGVEWAYKGLEEFEYITKRSIVFRSISVILIFLLIKSEKDYLIYGALVIFTNSASNILNFINLRKHITLKRYHHYEFRKHLKPILTLLFASIVITVHSNFDVMMLGFLKGESEVGLYNAASKIRDIIVSLSTAISIVLIPRASSYLKDKDYKNVNTLIENSIRISLLLAIPAAIYIVINSKDCILLVCGEQYLPANMAMITLSLCVIPLCFTNIFGNQLLVPSGNEKIYSQSVFIAMWINIVLNFLLIPKLGAFGAAIGTLVTECWNVFWMGRGTKKKIGINIEGIQIVKYIIAFAVSMLLSYIVKSFIKESVIFRILVSGGVCFICYYLLLFFMEEPITRQTVGMAIEKIHMLKK